MRNAADVERICLAALERPTNDRAAFLDDVCRGDEALRLEVESLLAHAAPAEQFFERPAVERSDVIEGLGGLSVGQRVGAYCITAKLASGGMGEVYRARDSQLGRDVAIKILPVIFAEDPERLARFEREARLLASLNHPNIATIHGVERVGSSPAIVMEMVAGETLANRISRGPLRVIDAIGIARQVAAALDSAHEKGIVHRDLKPANIKITPDGIAKVLDFGLAKATARALPPTGDSVDATVTAPTRDGLIIGTPAYMSPEQARGHVVDKRTDIWAFGCVLYEMVGGRPAFAGATVTDTLAAVIEREPDWSALPLGTAPAVAHVIRRCLEKDPRQRLRDIADGAAELVEDPLLNAPSSPRLSRNSAVWASLGVLIIAFGLWTTWPTPMPTAAPVLTRSILMLAAGQRLSSSAFEYPLALSPDATTLAYLTGGLESQLFVRELGALEARAIPGSAGAQNPFFSPDGKWLGFFADGALQKVAVAGGSPLRLASVSGITMGGTWGPDGTIVWATRGGDLMRISAGGGVAAKLQGTGPATWPQILPDGKTVLFSTANAAIAAIPLAGGQRRILARTLGSELEGPPVLGPGGGLAQVGYLANGLLVYGQSANPGAIRAIPFDLATMTVRGSPVSIANSIERAANNGAVYFVASNTVLLYASTRDRHQLVWVDPGGAETPISDDRAAFRGPRLSPDGQHIAVTINDETRRSDVWIYAAEGGAKRRLTADLHNLSVVWTPDGKRIAFNSSGRLVEMAADGAGRIEVLMDSPAIHEQIPKGTNAYPTSWSPDGADLLFHADLREVWAFSPVKTPALRQVLSATANISQAQISPDGHWIAYASDESSRNEVYIRRYPDLGEATPVSTNGGSVPHWSRTGHELFFRSGDAVMVADIETEPRLRASHPRRLFAGAYVGAGGNPDFDVSPDGTRFVMIKSDEASILNQLTVVQNWAKNLTPTPSIH